jgi:MinD superfamily P-loop ATPase
MVRELVVISGKGGTGKTSIAASFAVLAGTAVTADCDVDAADLHLVLEPRIVDRHPFSGGSVAVIDGASCTGCGRCEELCRFGAVSAGQKGSFAVETLSCEGCGVCAHFCPADAIEMVAAVNGEWFVSETRCGPMVHARLKPGGENSGKLVTIVRNEAKRLAKNGGTPGTGRPAAQGSAAESGREGIPLVIIDGSPGIGCPVIASITGSDLVLVVTEPTKSGIHDLERVVALTRHFGIETVVAINKYDINISMTEAIERFARLEGAAPVGRIRYDMRFTDAQVAGCSVVELGDSLVAADVRALWIGVQRRLNAEG